MLFDTRRLCIPKNMIDKYKNYKISIYWVHLGELSKPLSRNLQTNHNNILKRTSGPFPGHGIKYKYIASRMSGIFFFFSFLILPNLQEKKIKIIKKPPKN